MPPLLLLLTLVVVVGVVFGLPLAGLGLFPPLHATIVVCIRAGRLIVKRGHLRGQVLEDVAEVLASVGVTNGFIALSNSGRVYFSRTIPRSVHQRLSNVLLN
ncbi:MAG: hypothetical protein RLY20_2965 [Verrucomicrobiota bacterium]|jgi:hypothetical protein